MVWDYTEGNPFSDSTGNWDACLQWIWKCVSNAPAIFQGQIQQIDAVRNGFKPVPIAISTDPPYYDNIAYADLSDFFYVWLRHSLQTVWPSIFGTVLVPKADELVATPYRHGNIAPVDMAQGSIGPGMAIFTRYAQVLGIDDSPLTVKAALRLINTALDAFLSEQEADYDPDTRFALTWFETHGMAAAAYGVAEILATARNVSVAGVAEARVVEARAGKVRLLSRAEMPADWDPATDRRPTVWQATQHLIRRIEADGEPAAADLLRRLDAHADPARDLAYRLYQVCERNKWAEEGRAYNGLVIAWPELVKLAQSDREDLLI